jgi:hypothetical protein
VTEAIVGRQDLAVGQTDLTFADDDAPHAFFLRLENTQGVPVERQVWFRTQ